MVWLLHPGVGWPSVVLSRLFSLYFSIDHKTFVSYFFLSYHDLSTEITSETIFNPFLWNNHFLWKISSACCMKYSQPPTRRKSYWLEHHLSKITSTGTGNPQKLQAHWESPETMAFKEFSWTMTLHPIFLTTPRLVWGPPYPFLGAQLSHSCSNQSYCPYTDSPKACID